jgi:cyclic-di-GMP-binding protein
MLDLTVPPLLAESSLPFRDSAQAKAWLAQLPLTNTVQAHEALLEVVDRLNLTVLRPYERLKILELLREPVAFLQEARSKTFAGHPLPLTLPEKRARQHVSSLWAAMRKGYRYCLAGAADGDAEVVDHLALMVVRGIRYSGLQILNYGFAKQAVDDRLWIELHDWYTFAEARGSTSQEVRDSLYGYHRLSTPAAAYLRALLLAAAEPYRIAPLELSATDALAAWAANKLTLSLSAEKSELVRVVNLESAQGLQAQGRQGKSDERNLRYIDLAPLAESLQRRVRKLAGGAKFTDLRLPQAFTQVDAPALLQRLLSAWSTPPEGEPLQPTTETFCEVTVDLVHMHELTAGRVFTQPSSTAELSRLDTERIAALGHVGRSVADSGRLPQPERWQLLLEGAKSLRMCRSEMGKERINLNQLIGVRAIGDKEFQPAVIRNLVEQVQGIVVDAVALPGRAEAVAFRPLALTEASKHYTPGLTLVDRGGKRPATLLVPSRAFQPGRTVELMTQTTSYKARFTTLIERGPNFDWVNCEVE